MKNFGGMLFILMAALSAGAQQIKDDNAGRWRVDGRIEKDRPDAKAVNGFGALLVVLNNPAEFIKEWMKPEQPNVYSAKTAKPGEPLGIMVLFAGCRPGSGGLCNTEVDYTIYAPDGKIFFEQKALPLWKDLAPPKPNTQLGRSMLKFEMRTTNSTGDYKIKAKIYDKNADLSFELETQFTLAK